LWSKLIYHFSTILFLIQLHFWPLLFIPRNYPLYVLTTFWLLCVSICEAFSENYESVRPCMINFFECFWNKWNQSPGKMYFSKPIFAKAQKIVHLIKNQYVLYNKMRFLTDWYNIINIFYRKLKRTEIFKRRFIRIKQFHPIMLI